MPLPGSLDAYFTAFLTITPFHYGLLVFNTVSGGFLKKGRHLDLRSARRDDDIRYSLQKQKQEPISIYFRKVRTIRGCLEGLALMI